MNWLSNYIRPKIRSFVATQKDIPDDLWTKCPSCEGMLFQRELKEKLNVCYHCGYHLKMELRDRLDLIFDDHRWSDIPTPKVAVDPLRFKDKKRYSDRLKETQSRTGKHDAIMVAKGMVDGIPLVIAAFEFDFMGGSMGAAVGEGIVTAAETAIASKAALLVIPASGGARMQEGAVSLMQMPRTIIATNMVKEAGLPYLVLLTDPTTGGVSASFAMVGDIHLAEPGAMIGFAGKRVIEETIREQLPEGFQTAEYLQEHGMVDIVVPRMDLKATLSNILSMLLKVEKRSAIGEGGGRGRSGAAATGVKSSQMIAAGAVATLDPANQTVAKSGKTTRKSS